MNNWTIQNIWNDTLLEKQWKVEPRDYIRASEIGTSFADRWLKMKGIQPTNPYDARVLRVFEVGNLYEWLVRLVLIRSGLLVATQEEVRIEGDHLPVVGHLDFIGGGKPNFDEANKLIPQLEAIYFPKRMLTIADALIKELADKFPNGLPPLLYEVKSVNSMVFWRKDRMLDKAYDHHIMQSYTYVKGKKMNEARILYISKDDLTLAEFAVIPDQEMEDKWQKDVALMTEYLKSSTPPPLDPPVLWNADREKFEVNWMISRSTYFDYLMKCDQKEWQREMGNLATRCNARLKKGMSVEDVNKYLEAELAGGMTIKT